LTRFTSGLLLLLHARSPAIQLTTACRPALTCGGRLRRTCTTRPRSSASVGLGGATCQPSRRAKQVCCGSASVPSPTEYGNTDGKTPIVATAMSTRRRDATAKLGPDRGNAWATEGVVDTSCVILKPGNASAQKRAERTELKHLGPPTKPIGVPWVAPERAVCARAVVQRASATKLESDTLLGARAPAPLPSHCVFHGAPDRCVGDVRRGCCHRGEMDPCSLLECGRGGRRMDHTIVDPRPPRHEQTDDLAGLNTPNCRSASVRSLRLKHRALHQIAKRWPLRDVADLPPRRERGSLVD
jgi:hypothetical protein